MINMFDDKQIQQIVKDRKKKFVLYFDIFFILTPNNHIFCLDRDGDLSLVEEDKIGIPVRNSEIMQTYGFVYKHKYDCIIFTYNAQKQIKAFYNTCINDLEYLFFMYYEGELLRQELKCRNLA